MFFLPKEIKKFRAILPSDFEMQVFKKLNGKELWTTKSNIPLRNLIASIAIVTASLEKFDAPTVWWRFIILFSSCKDLGGSSIFLYDSSTSLNVHLPLQMLLVLQIMDLDVPCLLWSRASIESKCFFLSFTCAAEANVMRLIVGKSKILKSSGFLPFVLACNWQEVNEQFEAQFCFCLALAPQSRIFGSCSRTIWSKKTEKTSIIYITRLPHKLYLWNRNPHIRLRVHHLKFLAPAPAIKNFLGSGSTALIKNTSMNAVSQPQLVHKQQMRTDRMERYSKLAALNI